MIGKIYHFIIFDEIGQLAAGMNYIHVQLPLNLTAIYHQYEIIESNLKRIMSTYFKSNISEDFSKGIKNVQTRNVDKNLPNGRIILKLSTLHIKQ